ncbi:redox-active protein [Desulfobacter hydrogenophilus]|uniref:C_GCAxxG_C_C family protein n=1 Tax=Desulfobacter hydrogenophilus TaxID=2291 RepID=A0A328FJI1_9BACT|nr:DV_1555 family C-GCAxxG-C-C protein [Desulfobacter hydrogenophilus]NDY70692.1 C_GCAxxG_C_C family protein [Desulfobacter hydrogenophilus]QBH12691.1 C_GCAxxG_C_C family protein [Desulfobacter hydrogenophilus]RAM03343.1 redox-active protein [Desulfobacter hydrogenophilus]
MDNIEILKLKSKGYCCSQIMVQLVLDLADLENRELVNFARGLCMGSKLETGTCGILTAGLCILAMYAPQEPDLRASMQNDFKAFFTTAAPKGIQCRQIAGAHYPNLNPETCPALLAQAHEALMNILTEHEMDPADLDNE